MSGEGCYITIHNLEQFAGEHSDAGSTISHLIILHQRDVWGRGRGNEGTREGAQGGGEGRERRREGGVEAKGREEEEWKREGKTKERGKHR